MVYHTFQTIIIPAIVAFIITAISIKFLMDYFSGAGIVAEDKNKGKHTILPGSGGVAVAFGIVVGILVYIFGGSFIYAPVLNISNLMAAALSILLIAFGGFIDDINVKSRQVKATGIMDIKQGLKQWQKPLLTIIGVLPLIAINAGVSTLSIPFIGLVDFGLLYPLLILPLAIIFVPNAVNLLGGFNGLEAGTALVASLGFLIYSVFFGTYTGAFISTILFASLLAFLLFNFYPAKVLPGDSLTYTIGAAFVVIMVMGNAESFGVIVFIPWIIEFLLHAKGRFGTTDLGIRQKDGTFKAPYGKKIYSLTHIVMNIKKVREYEVPIYLSLVEALFVLLALSLKLYGIL
jgi:UDP-N-acetylglucosamine--dolichyl-phosphate N-acetylglucosaminephosphotransferase